MKPLAFMCLAAGAMLALDHASKRLVVSRLRSGPTRSVAGIRLCYALNRRALGFTSVQPATLTAVLALDALVLAALVQFGPWFATWPGASGLGLALGGAAGNVVDRWHRGGVVDFIDLGWWPIFNLADAGIVIGLVVALLSLL